MNPCKIGQCKLQLMIKVLRKLVFTEVYSSYINPQSFPYITAVNRNDKLNKLYNNEPK